VIKHGMLIAALYTTVLSQFSI